MEVELLGYFTCHPLPQVQVFFDLSPFVSVFQWFLRLVFHFTEGVFRVADGLTDDFQRFGHSLFHFFQVEPGAKPASGRSLGLPIEQSSWYRLLQAV